MVFALHARWAARKSASALAFAAASDESGVDNIVASGAEVIDPGAMGELASAGAADPGAAAVDEADGAEGALYCACALAARTPTAAAQASCKKERFMFHPFVCVDKE